ncbi:heterogeneous nuclear ribonucleoprotein Q isoform X1 [Dermacentor andersoni]|uniref:heterogeneous nuclear ribonucleoprotein Q isoform X1 n=1 Tax=Dermacentor andersoni TaxID=34620 RepID=UPI0021552FD6|nr:heterogeneous nuclear ribonucleoprotein Q-like isoform X1 [Dermacentor andersoni]XP_050025885.1 heterogeneous nuclear ribonucleoprotein Q-like isoform X1 [Dermacentor andersoni]
MAEGNGDAATVEPMDESSATEHSADYAKLVGHGLQEKVAAQLDAIFQTGKLAYADLDERALDALKEFPADGALAVLKQFLDSSLEHVSNKSAYLCGVMKTYRQKSKLPGASGSGANKGPDEEKIRAILDRTGYSLDVTTGQRKYGGPPPGWTGPQPSSGCEVFVGKIPKDMFEDELIPLFEKCGKIWDLRLMMDPLSGLNRGYAFITFCNREGAHNSVRELDNHEIRKGKYIGVTISINNHRLFVGNIPKNRGKEELFEEFSKHAPGLTEVIIYSSPDDKKKNRGFCFLEYESHKAASLAKRRLSTGRIKVWSCDIIVDWADPQEEPDEETMAKVKVLYVRNLTADVTEEKLKELFEAHGRVERVKKIKDYAFVHFEERDHAVHAMEQLQGKDLCGAPMEVSLAKPPSDKKKKEEVLRNRERRMMQMMQQRIVDVSDYRMMGCMPPPPPLRGPRGGGGGRGPPVGPRSYDYDYDYYGYSDYRGGYADPYYEDYYGRYDDYYDYGYPAAAPPRGRPAPERARGGQRGVTRGGRGRGRAPRARAGRGAGPVSRGGRGGAPPRGSLAGKRKFDGGHQNQGDSKRRFHNSNQQQQDDGQQWYQDSFKETWG